MTKVIPHKLENMIGIEISAMIPMFNPNCVVWVTLVDVEAAGIWIESEQLTIGWCRGTGGHDELDDSAKVTAFVPFTSIRYIASYSYKDGSRGKILSFAGKEVAQADPGDQPA